MAEPIILVVDDSPTEQQATRMALEAKGYSVLTAQRGDEGISVAKQKMPALIVLDIVLPDTSGFSVCRLLKDGPQTKGIKIILLSSKSEEFDRYWGLRQGADLYMTKPFKDEELLANVERLLK